MPPTSRESAHLFVAMWFDEEVSVANDNGIAHVIRDAEYEPVRIDNKEHSDRVDDQFIGAIRRARFLVCDLTCGLLPGKNAQSNRTADARSGVCFEVWFGSRCIAHGLGKPVTWTCREDPIHHVYFDLRQYNCISWKAGQESELRKALEPRVRAVIP